jgi:hypothetical protein
MAVLDAKETQANLIKKGFVPSGGDHVFLEYYHEGKYILHTKISHGEKDLKDFHIGMMSRQCKLSKKDFVDLAKCPLSAESYIGLLRQNGIIDSVIDTAANTPANNKKFKNKKHR